MRNFSPTPSDRPTAEQIAREAQVVREHYALVLKTAERAIPKASSADPEDLAQTVWAAALPKLRNSPLLWADAEHLAPALVKMTQEAAADALSETGLISRRTLNRVRDARAALADAGKATPAAQEIVDWVACNRPRAEHVSLDTVLLASGEFVPLDLAERTPSPASSADGIDLDRGSLLAAALLRGESADREDDDLFAYLLLAEAPRDSDPSKVSPIFNEYDRARLLGLSLRELRARKLAFGARIRGQIAA